MADVAICGAVDFPLVEPIVAGFATMNGRLPAQGRGRPDDAAEPAQPPLLHRPPRLRRLRGGRLHRPGHRGLRRRPTACACRIELAGWGMTSDAHHFVAPNLRHGRPRAWPAAIDDAGIAPADIDCGQRPCGLDQGRRPGRGARPCGRCSAAGFRRSRPTSRRSATPWGPRAPSRSILAMEGMRRGTLLPTINYRPDPEIAARLRGRRRPAAGSGVRAEERLRFRRLQRLHGFARAGIGHDDDEDGRHEGTPEQTGLRRSATGRPPRWAGPSPTTWERAVTGEAGFRKVTRCQVESACDVVGEIPDWDPRGARLRRREGGLQLERRLRPPDHGRLPARPCAHAGLDDGPTKPAPRTACLIGSAINGADAFRDGHGQLPEQGPLKVSPYLLPNLCANLPCGQGRDAAGLHRARSSRPRGPAPPATTPSASGRG
ncbi:MAG: hypothetical protein MZV70_67650 [Desulfobacterales bacterium]|nr:hypothetical protein [Desulfobacterales bacterium]